MARDIRTADDDGRTIADMSGVGSGLSDALESLLPSERRAGEARGAGQPFPQSERAFSDELQGPEERLMVIMGTLKAALSIGMAYVIVFGIAIALMVWFWT